MQQNLIHILFSITLSFVLVSGFSQNGNNPFELTPRLQESATQDKLKTQTNTKTSNDTSNPFDLEGKNTTTKIEAEEGKTNNENTTSPSISAPNANNPFEVGTVNTSSQDSTETEKIIQTTATEVDNETTPTNNPFDLVAPSSETEQEVERVEAKKPPIEKTVPLPKIAEKVTKDKSRLEKTSQRFLAPVIMIMLTLLALLVTLFRSIVAKSYQAFLNDNILSIIYRERGSILVSPYTILYIMFLINAGIFIFLLSEYYGIAIANSRFWNLILSIGLVFAIFIFKHLVLRLLAFIFPITKEVKLYNFTIVIFGIIIGMLLVPANILIAYAPSSLTGSLVYTAIGVVGLIYLFRSLRGLFIANRFLLFHKFHFLLYICTVEIAPIIIFLKLIS